jgi:hypothetical protein
MQHLQSISLWWLLRWGLVNYLPGAGLELGSPARRQTDIKDAADTVWTTWHEERSFPKKEKSCPVIFGMGPPWEIGSLQMGLMKGQEMGSSWTSCVTHSIGPGRHIGIRSSSIERRGKVCFLKAVSPGT